MKVFQIFLLLGLGFLFSQCESKDTIDIGTDTGTGGSLSRFAIRGDYLYTLNNNQLKTYRISDPNNMEFVTKLTITETAETIFSLDDLLFVGTQSGMLIYTIQPSGAPKFESKYEHIVSCDPVVANQHYAYVTLRSGNRCGWFGANQLDIVDINNLLNPSLVQSYPMSNPLGLGLDGQTLFVCEQEYGLKVYNVTNANNIQLLTQMADIHALDVIPLNGLLLVITPNSIIQYNYTDLNHIVKVSEIPVEV